MIAREDVSVIVPAAGAGERLGRGPKAWLPLHGRPVIEWIVDKALQVGAEVLVACSPGRVPPAGATRVEGGATRQASVRALAEAASRPWCLLWDAASPFASIALLQRALQAAQATGASGAAVPRDVALLRIEHGRVVDSAPASAGANSQTPQAYRTELLRAVAARADAEGWATQSTVQLFLRAGHEVVAVEGERLNLKLTTADDWLLAQALADRLRR